ncbi:MAG TPA: hypothetical protein VHY84_12815 [Bryobacteraceae bacterium]|nr:hypothetical protein [Bryobacteraceae bacterium]
MLDCTWNDLEAEIVLRNLGGPHEEQQRLQRYYLKLREECRKAMQTARSTDPEQTEPQLH